MKEKIKNYLLLLVGILAFSISFNLFLSPNNIVFGGVTGLSIVFKDLFNWDTALFVFIINAFLLILSYFLLGKEMTLRSIIGSLLLPVFMKLTELIFVFFPTADINLELAVIYGAVLSGLGLGLIYKAGFTTGGTDIIHQIVNKFIGLSIGTSMIIIDSIILCSSIFVFGIVKSMYAGVALYIISKLTDKVILGISNSKAFYIVTDEPDKVKKFVIKEMGHGITEFNAFGGFKKETQKVLFCVIPTMEYYTLKKGILKIDKEAFFVVVDSYEVSGGA